MTLSSKARSALAGRLRQLTEGDVVTDDFSRGRYATDGSPFQTFPAAVVLPKTQDDLLATVRVAWEAGLAVVARGGGTGRAGQAVGEGLVIDCSKYLTRLLYYDASAQTCIVEPGITPAALNEALKPERVWFPVDIESALQATIGGMAATDAIGARAMLYGRMRDNIAACDVILSHGGEISFDEIPHDFAHNDAAREESTLVLDLLEAAQNSEAAIRALHAVRGGHYGYNVQALLPETAEQNLAALLAGSEGTLAIAKRIELKLARMPLNRAIGVCHLPSLTEALRAIPRIAALDPIGIELTSRRILEFGLTGRDASDPARRLLRKDAEALLFVEFMQGNRVENARQLKALAEAMAQLGHVRAVSELIGPAAQEAARRAHRAGLSRVYGTTTAPAALLPLTQLALPLDRLAAGAEDFLAVFRRHDVEVVCHGHVGVGALYLRPWIRSVGVLPDAEAIAGEAEAALQACDGALGNVEGLGIARSFAMEAIRDPALTHLFEEIKTRFDPHNRFNPGKIVMPSKPQPAMLRRTAASEAATALAALNCDGTALCRRLDKSVMCPSFKVTRDERDSPRGRANTLRLALSGELGADALASDAMMETMSLCVSCKACRSECPRGVDIAQARIAVQSERVGRNGVSKFEESIAYLPHRAPRLRRWRHVLNLRDILPRASRLSERITGVSADRPWPRWSAAPFSGNRLEAAGDGPELLLFADTFNSHFDPVTLRSAADVLAASGFRLRLLAPPPGERPFCCGRTFLEAGLVEEARIEARRLIAAALPFVERGVPLVGLEPACILTIRDELVNTLAEDGAEALARASLLFEEVMSQPIAVKAIKPRLMKIEAEALFAAHCHQHAFGTATLARRVAAMVPGINVIEADRSCCGMGTTFGYRPEMVATSLRMGEQSLFPQIRRASRDTLLVADGFACRKQINDGTGRTARHTAVLLKLALAAKEKFGDAADGDFRPDNRLSKRLSRLRRHYFN